MEKELKDYLNLYLGCEVKLINDISEDYGDDIYDAPEVNEIGKLTLVNTGNMQIHCGENSESWPYGVEFGSSYIAFWDCKDFKPILRPLSSLMEYEMVEVFKLCSLYDLTHCEFEFGEEPEMWINAIVEGRVIDAIKFIGDNVEMMDNYGSFHAINPISPVINWYRKNLFDVDGLIDAGIAIDKSKL